MALGEYLAEEIALDCAQGAFSRREALRRLMLLGLTAPAAAVLLSACGSDDEPASATAPSTTGGSTTGGSPTTGGAAAPAPAEDIRFAGPNGQLIGALAAAADPRGAVLVIHENRGLTAHIRTIPPRLAASGYTALALDLLSEEGGTSALGSEADATAALGKAPAERMIADMRAGLDELGRRAPGAKLAVIGFCFGGGMVWQLLAAGEPRLSAAVPFYGPAPGNPDFRGSPNAAVLAIYGALDTRVNATQETVAAALDAAGLVHETRVFPGADHAFFNDTGPRYNPTAAAAAYDALLAWFAAHLS